MGITTKEIREQFDIWNAKAFNGELPTPMFELMTTKTLLGQFKRRYVGDKPIYTIRISTYYERSFNDYVNTIVHEMLHFYIRYKGIKDSSSHGKIWKRMAAQLNDRFNLNIQRTGEAGVVSEHILEKKKERKIGVLEYVFLCKMADGSPAAAVAPYGKIAALKPRFDTWKAVNTYKIIKAPWAETYNLRHLKTAVGVRGISQKEYDALNKYKRLAF